MQYPENRETLKISDRWRAELYMPHDDNNEHACTACGICMINCPNGTITVTSNMIETEEGKKKRVLDKHVWDYGMCTFCNICVITCPSDAIFFNNDFEGAMFDRSKLIHTLNKPGSKLREKKREPKPATVAAPVKKTESATAPATEKKVEEVAKKVETATPTEKAPKIETQPKEADDKTL